MSTHDYKCPTPWRNIDSDPPSVNMPVWVGGIQLISHPYLMVMKIVFKGTLANDGLIDPVPGAKNSLFKGDVKNHIWRPITNEDKPEHPWNYADIGRYLKVSCPTAYAEFTKI